jgi:hypothetical protein
MIIEQVELDQNRVYSQKEWAFVFCGLPARRSLSTSVALAPAQRSGALEVGVGRRIWIGLGKQWNVREVNE